LETPETTPSPLATRLAAFGGASAALVTLVGFVFLQVARFGFVNFDDPRYVASNPIVQQGLTWRGLRWALTTFHTGNWHPLTWLSLMADVEILGGGARVHHLVNVALHAANAILLLAVLLDATGRPWRSALVAALFAVHPLHVESVAWISERKDLLSTAFGLLALLAYARYVRTRSRRWYGAVAVAFAASLAFKPMLVTFPLLLLVWDRWPLRRGDAWRALVFEKAPLFVLSLTSAVVTLVAQHRGGAVSEVASVSIAARMANAVVAYATYLARTVWPSGLAAIYPHPAMTSRGFAPLALVASLLLLLGLTALAIRERSDRPYLLAGWLWFLVALVPVIGIVQVGMQSMADRYTYLPLIGIFVALAWLVPEPVASSWKKAIAAAGCALVLLAAGLARVQAGYWRDSVTLFQHALAVTTHNAPALRNLGVAYVEQGQYPRGIDALRESLRLVPGDAWAWMDLGIALSSTGDNGAANEAFREAFRLRPDDENVLYNVGIFAAMTGHPEAVVQVHARLKERSPELADKLAERAGLR
jgi:tetratricopeptide (TPR) repeat protein